jgi:hypothetical protein
MFCGWWTNDLSTAASAAMSDCARFANVGSVMGLRVRKPCVHNHGRSRVSQADVTWTIGCFRTRSCDDRGSDWVITTNLGVDRQVYIAGALCGFSSPRLSRSGAVPSSGILSEGDKRDSKGDMPEPPRSSPPLQFSGTEGGDRVQRRLCSGASISDSAEEDP